MEKISSEWVAKMCEDAFHENSKKIKIKNPINALVKSTEEQSTFDYYRNTKKMSSNKKTSDTNSLGILPIQVQK